MGKPFCMGIVVDKGDGAGVGMENCRSKPSRKNGSGHTSYLRCISGIFFINKDISVEISSCITVKYWSWKGAGESIIPISFVSW